MSGKRFHIETYGCQMNFSDSEIVQAILAEQGHIQVESPEQAEIIFLNTCSIRDNAEKKIWERLQHLRALRRSREGLVIGVLGCMAERVRERFLEHEKLVDIVVGPDAYRDIPNLLAQVDDGRNAVNVLLSLDETYADITPVRTVGNGVSAFVSIMRGCDNMCSFCVVPFTRGRERSRNMESILDEVRQLYEQGYKEVTFLGQNVNSYRDDDHDFTDVMVASAEMAPEMRFRFASPHPKDFPDSLLIAIRDYPNLCNYIHIPAQSGSSTTLERMRRPYTRAIYSDLIQHMKATIPGLSLSTDIIAGFCGETEQEHQDTLSLMAEVRYDLAYMFAYSERERTLAARRYVDDVPEAVKKRRLTEIIEQQRRISHENNQLEIGRSHLVLVEGPSKRTDAQFCGRTDTNKMVVFDRMHFQVGQYIEVEITSANAATLMATPLRQTTIREYHHAMVST